MYREIVTRAIIGKGKVSNSVDLVVNPTYEVSKVLGCWIINHNFSSFFDNEKVFVKGSYDVHIWCGFNNDNDSYIHKQKVEYMDEFNVISSDKESIDETSELVSKCTKYPACSSLMLNENNSINVRIDKEIRVDIIGETKLKVQVDQCDNCADFNVDNIDTDYLK